MDTLANTTAQLYALDDSRVNLVNRRREFFFINAPQAVEKLKQLDPGAEFLSLS